MSTSNDLRKLRAKSGKAAEKKILLKDYIQLESMAWHYVILATDNELSTYQGLYPEGIGKVRDAHMANMKTVEKQIRDLCH